ncbi:MAG: c-type cytochrome [Pseudomonadota bacterium]
MSASRKLLVGYLKFLVALGVLAAVGGTAFLYSGIYHIGADDHHTPPVYWALETLRESSIALRAKHIEVPPLDDPQQLLSGGADYNDMCAGCHLKPGKSKSDLSVGLYPEPPNLAVAAQKTGREALSPEERDRAAARHFWIIKHGIKASGMPAWGITHDDQRIWAMVAFIQRLPTLTPEQYQILTARDP